MDVLFEFLFFVVTATISFLAYRVYLLTKQEKTMLFGSAFGAISVSYLLKSLLNIAIYNRVSVGGGVYNVVRDVISLRDIGEFVQGTFMLFGLLIIIYISIHNKDKTLFSLVTALTFAVAVISQHRDNLIYVIITIFFIYILMHYWRNYKLLPTRNKLIVFVGFLLLFCANLLYIFMPFHQYFYVGGHLAELLGYLLLASNLLLVFKKR